MGCNSLNPDRCGYGDHFWLALHCRDHPDRGLHGQYGQKGLTEIDNLPFDYYEKCFKKIESEKLDNKVNDVYIFSDKWKNIKESKLYYPLKKYLQSKNYTKKNHDREVVIANSKEIENFFEEFDRIDVDDISPRQSLDFLYRLKSKRQSNGKSKFKK